MTERDVIGREDLMDSTLRDEALEFLMHKRRLSRQTADSVLGVPPDAYREAVDERDELRNMLIRVLDAVALLDHPKDQE
jgi:hypothetical protein